MRTLGVATTFMLTAFTAGANAAPAASAAPPAASSAAPAPAKAPVAPAPAKAPVAPAPAKAPVAPAPPKAPAAPAPPKAGGAPAATPAPAKAGAAAPSAGAPAEQPASGAPAPSGAPPPPDTSAPPIYYVEPQGPSGEQIYEPEPPMNLYEPPPPPPPPRNMPPRTAFWAGARLGVMIPFGNLWVDGYGSYYRRRAFSDYASPGPVFELDVGARLARHYNVFALWEHASLGTGNIDDASFGGQDRGATNLFGVGFRFSTDPSRIGFVVEVGLGYRQFSAYWNDGTELSLTDGWLDAHLGLGADIRMNRWLSLSPMMVLGGGSFGDARWHGPGGTGSALTPFDQNGEYGTLSFVLGAHADIF